jgi:hypothetical protein
MRRKPDYSLINSVNDVFGDGESVQLTTSGTRPKVILTTPPKQKKPPVTEKKKAANNAEGRFTRKLEEELFTEFDHKDWLDYFKHKYREMGSRYFVGDYVKEYSVFKSLMKELHWDAIKLMIDFLFDSDQDIVDKRTLSVYHLSKGWINTIYQNSLLWKDGDYRPRSAKNNPPKRNREWQEPVAASRKDAGAGIHYGKPVRDDDEPEDPQPKRKVRL